MRRILFFHSNYTAMLVSQIVFFALLVSGAVVISYEILPDIGLISSLQWIFIWSWAGLSVLSAVFACWAMIAFISSISQNISKRYLWIKNCRFLLAIPVLGSLFLGCYLGILALDKQRKSLSLGIVWNVLTLLWLISLFLLFYRQAEIDIIMLVTLSVAAVNYIIFLILAKSLTNEVVSPAAKIIIGTFALILILSVSWLPLSRYLLEADVQKMKNKIAAVYGASLDAQTLKERYYHGLKPNVEAFAKIMPLEENTEQDEVSYAMLPELPEELKCFYGWSIVNSQSEKKLQEWLKKEKTFFKNFDSIINSQKYLKMPYSCRTYDGFLYLILLPEMKNLRHWARINCIRIKDAVKDGKIDDALKYNKQIERIREYAGDDDLLLSYVFSFIIEHIRINGLEAILSSGKLSSDQIKTLLSDFKTFQNNVLNNYHRGLYGETICCLDYFEIARKILLCDDLKDKLDGAEFGREILLFYEANYNDNWFSGLIPEKTFRKYFNKSYTVDLLDSTANRLYQYEVLHALKYNYEASKIPFNIKKLRQIEKDAPTKFPMFQDFVFGLHELCERVLLRMTQFNTVETALNVELYRRKYNKLPNTLADLVPEFMEKIPIDELNKQPLKYVHGKFKAYIYDFRDGYDYYQISELFDVKGFRVYSVGHNKKDENGRYKSFRLKSKDDIGFSVIDEIITKPNDKDK